MKKLLAAGLTLTFGFAISAMAGEWTGVISDAKCGAAHAEKMNEACVKSCVKRGTEPVFVSEGKVLKIDKASQEKVMPLLGKKVKVTGSENDGTVTIDSIQAESGT